MTEFTEASLEGIILTRLRVAAQQELPRYVAQMAEVESIADMVRDGLILRMRSETLALRHDCQHATGSLTVDFKAPATWWQHLKQQYANPVVAALAGHPPAGTDDYPLADRPRLIRHRAVPDLPRRHDPVPRPPRRTGARPGTGRDAVASLTGRARS